MVLAHWTLPENVHRAVNLHQSPKPGTGEPASIARLLNASDRIARILCEILPPHEVVSACIEATEHAGTRLEVLHKTLPKVGDNIQELASVLRIDLIPNKAYLHTIRALEEHLTATAAR